MSGLEKPDLKKGVPIASFPEDGKLLGSLDGEEVLLVRRTEQFFAAGAHCTDERFEQLPASHLDREMRGRGSD
jgi:nitrite reductase/ring-hydroxylating ferredoxin subunit